MASNLMTARSLIQADLDHARSVLELWTHQVEELEKALEQIDAVSTSRSALRVQYQGTGARTPALDAPVAVPAAAAATAEDKPRRGRKPKNAGGAPAGKPDTAASGIKSRRAGKLSARNTLSAAQDSESRRGKPDKAGAASQPAKKHAAKYRDPDSGKTWSGIGRRPGWFVGAPDQFAIRGADQGSSNEAPSGSTAAS